MSFAEPASAPGIQYHDLKGSLLIFEVTELVKDVSTDFGIKDAVRCTVTVVDGELAGETYADTLVFPLVLLSQLRPNIGKSVLGRLEQGEQKKGQKPPWKLQTATDTDKETAAKFLASQAAGQLTAEDL